MKIKLVLTTATALSVLMATGALAGSGNNTYLSQQGDYNRAVVGQAGNFNNAGTNSLRITQTRSGLNPSIGLYNDLTINQSGNNNNIGLAGSGVTQSISYAHNIGSTYYSGQNVINIIQSSSDNAVGSVLQNSTTHQDGNLLTISQIGTLGHNTVGSVSQIRSQTTRNVAKVTQSGGDNNIARISQYVWNAGIENTLVVNMTGNNNGNGSLSGFAMETGAQGSVLIQGDGPGANSSARNSYAHLDISGSDNQFGITQYGNGNSVGTLVISGDNNQLGSFQRGDRNLITVATVSGARNNVGLHQTGNDNAGSATVDGNDSSLGITQLQNNNIATANISGDNNGGGALVGAAGVLALASNLVSGQILQDGLGNSASLSIGNSSNNQFGYLQRGNGNTIVGSVTGTGSNSAAVVQLGNNNMSNFVQFGGGNMVSVNQ